MIEKCFIYGFDTHGDVVYVYYDDEYGEAAFGHGICMADIMDSVDDAVDFIEVYHDFLTSEGVSRLSIGNILVEDVENKQKPQE